MCEFDRFRVLTKARWRQQEGLDQEENSAAHNSQSNVSQTSRKGGTASRPPPASDALQPNPKLEAGAKLPHRLGDYFSVKKFASRPLEDIDEFYENKQVSFGKGGGEMNAVGSRVTNAEIFSSGTRGSNSFIG